MTTTLDLVPPPEFTVDFGDRDFVQHPWPTLAAMRTAGPVVRNLGTPDIYLVTGFTACQRVLGRVAEFHSLPEYLTDLFGGVVFEALDSTDHDTVRAVWANAFRREDIERDRTAVVARVVRSALGRYLARVRSGERVDAVAELTFEIPGLIIATMLGLGHEESRELLSCARDMAQLHAGLVTDGPDGERLVQAARGATARLNRLMADQIEKRRVAPGDDLISSLVSSDVARSMAHRDIVATCTQLVFAGSETSAKLMAHALAVFAENPDQQRLVAADRSLVGPAIEELLRYIGPVQAGPAREVGEGVHLEGNALEAGAKIMPLIAAGNRDPSRWDQPDRFLVGRPAQRHLGFGFGMHSCLGQNLARLELVTFLEVLFDECPQWRVETPVDYGIDFTVRGPQQIFVVPS